MKTAGVSFFLLIVLLLAPKHYAFSQKHPEPFITKFKWTVFITPDSTYKITRFVEQDGVYFFWRGFIDSTYIGDGMARYTFEKKKNTHSYVDTFIYERGIDTLSFYFLTKLHYGSPFEKAINGVTYVIDSLYEDIEMSYIFKALNLSSSDSAISIMFPEDDLNFSHKYSLISIKEADNEHHWLFMFSGSSRNLDGFLLTRKDSMLVSNKKLDNILGRVSEVRKINNKFCLRPGNPWVLILNKEKRFVMSRYCYWGTKDEELIKVINLFESMRSLQRKYKK